MYIIGYLQMNNTKKVMDVPHYIWRKNHNLGLELKISIWPGI